ncbi:hypothetical protein PMZ80_000418 [Knufia obscura]|uniref:Rad4-domain-containing protein n=1 Tax=Knufia obscura TaxID=1635080 RepID=A0ABR0S0A6_9EURO|nr:hypothetical protein PMZ80_000418 [Knufia obscura]
MPRRKNVASGTSRSQKAPTRRSARRAATQEQDVPDVYQDMLIEAFHNNPDDFAPSPRLTKRRKVEDESTLAVNHPSPVPVEHVNEPPVRSTPPPAELVPAQTRQVVFNNDISDSDDDSDLGFEDVEIAAQTGTEADETTDDQAEPKILQIDLSAPKATARKLIARRKPVTKAERDFRLHVHKWHLLTLLVHVATRNKWCDNEQVQRTLKPLIGRKTISNLHLPETRTQAERKFAFEKAIEEVCAMWRTKWKVTARGIRRAVWRDNIDMAKEVEDAEDPVDLEDFLNAAKQYTGSRDLGAQLFCALLRSVAVETRLVCSLQVLPFSRIAKGETPQKPPPAYINAGTQDYGTGRSSFGSSRKKKQKKVVDSPFPTWWVEVFNPAITQWTPLDPIVRNTINKPRTGFEPPGSDNLNGMSYVIAFEDDGIAKDVTRRYASLYNAKTRKTRVESTKGGQEWFDRAMHVFSRGIPETRDEIEDAALARRVQMEGMPKNVQDFKDHPVYVLERHLRNNEVIHPRRESGKFTVGTGKNQKLESVYRAQDVHACRSADGWYRRGRDVKVGEQALKRVVPRKKRSASVQIDDEDDEVEGEGVALYAEFQTDVYVPPPVVDGHVPRNGYGNLDVYVKSMIPAGGVHIRHPLVTQAAKILGIDAAEAVTGFKFKGRQGTAIVDGVVVDIRFTAAMLATIVALEDKLEEEVNAQRSAIMLGVWKKMHAVLRVRQKVHEEYGQTTRGNGVADDDEDEDDPSYGDDLTYEDEADAGGFVADVVGEATKASKAEEAANLSLLKERAPIVLPPLVIRQRVVVVRSPHKQDMRDENGVQGQGNHDDLFDPDPDESGGFIPDDEVIPAEPDGFMVEDEPDAHNQGAGFLADDDISGGGGFVPNDEEYGGGFVPEESAGGGGFRPEADHANAIPEAPENPFRPDLVKEDVRRPVLRRRVSTSHVSDEGGGFVVDEQQDEGSNDAVDSNLFRSDLVSEAVQRPVLSRRVSVGEEPVLASQRTNGHPVPPLSTQESTSSRHKHAKGKQKERDGADDSMSDASLPSHDPEEDDAEPEWLADAFDDDM